MDLVRSMERSSGRRYKRAADPRGLSLSLRIGPSPSAVVASEARPVAGQEAAPEVASATGPREKVSRVAAEEAVTREEALVVVPVGAPVEASAEDLEAALEEDLEVASAVDLAVDHAEVPEGDLVVGQEADLAEAPEEADADSLIN